ncbi:NADH-quinone oxidoreductase subunit L [Candidatus Chlorohelix sp.]|uniref:NADH-quinone oxidoreductase subunit L n=1 Tax=Candidatus Chlorohelix sp. TaxID=3139201 RepID=UPI00302E6B26
MAEAIGLVVLFPLLGFLAIALLGNSLSEKGAAYLACAAVGFAFLSALASVPAVYDPKDVFLYTWTQAGNWKFSFGLLADPLSVFMCLIVTGVGFLIHLYSIGYMTGEHGEPEADYRRFFAYMNLFVFSMLLLVTSNNFIFLLVGWAGVGLSSFLLIGFYKDKPSAVKAARKALVMNTIGDVGLLLGIFVIILNTGAVNYYHAFRGAEFASDGGWRDIASILLLIAAVAKSAQLPLHTWLPDAMEGPTPVSALIHAATMVTAGVYLITRAHPIFAYSEVALIAIPVIGAASAFYAATCAIIQTDIKRVLAYSTMSQLGYMFMAAGAGAYEAAMFHLLTHAFFKALLFLSAGAVIHAIGGEQGIRNMGGLGKQLPLARWTFLIGALAISGIPVFSGFFSKEAIFAAFPLFGGKEAQVGFGLNETGHIILGWVALLVAVMTAAYMFRLYFLVFSGPKAKSYQTHESPLTMKLPLMVLGALSVVGGFVYVPGAYNLLEKWFEKAHEYVQTTPTRWLIIPYETIEWTNLIGAVGAAIIGWFIAYGIFGRAERVAPSDEVKGFAAFLQNGWYLDKLYYAVVATPVVWVSKLLTKQADKDVAEALDWGIGGSLWASSKLIRKTETGYVRNYALGILVGAVALLAYVLVAAIQR